MLLPVIVPRHAERRAEVKHELERAGFDGGAAFEASNRR